MGLTTFHDTAIEGCWLIEVQKSIDDRGSFQNLFNEQIFLKTGFDEKIVQVNHSVNPRRGTLRGLHFQIPPDAEIKIVTCLTGKIQDVAVDLRKNSPSFLKWIAVELSHNATNILLIPKGCAHGFITLEDDSTILYLHSEKYVQESERGINYLDPRLNITWKESVNVISNRDKNLPFLENNFEGLVL